MKINSMHILADASMPQVAVLVEHLQAQGMALTLSTFQGRQPSAAQLSAADVLMIRSITRVDDTLLQQAPKLRWLGTATIGTEHVDAAACAAAGVTFASTPGVNARAVGDYVASAVASFALEHNQLPQGEVAIVGAGHTGRAAGERLQGLGLNVHYYDPPLHAQGIKFVHNNWQRVLNSAIISLHVPLTTRGEFSTRHLFNTENIQQLAAGCLLINASRGAVVAEQALLQAMQRQQALHVVLDVWEHEPHINHQLLPWLHYATAHIAGHSLAGKVGGSLQLFEKWLQFAFGRNHSWQLPPLNALLQPWPQAIAPRLWQQAQAPTWQMLASWVRGIYDIRNDDKQLRDQVSDSASFDALRKAYQARPELSCGQVHGGDWLADSDWQQRLSQLSFSFSRL